MGLTGALCPAMFRKAKAKAKANNARIAMHPAQTDWGPRRIVKTAPKWHLLWPEQKKQQIKSSSPEELPANISTANVCLYQKAREICVCSRLNEIFIELCMHLCMCVYMGKLYIHINIYIPTQTHKCIFSVLALISHSIHLSV